MTLQESVKNQPPFRALPLWRKILVVCGLGFFVSVWAMTLYMELNLYGVDPDRPVAATGHIYPVGAAWGYMRYATWEERDRLYFWKRQMGWMGVPFAAAAFLWMSYRPKQ